MLQLCISQTISETPFTFKSTGIRVYSIEEALYHVYHYWRESAEELASVKIAAWAAELGLPKLAAKITAIAEIQSFSRRMLAFLGIIEYFNESELAEIKTELEGWENRVEWERLKDRADQLVMRGEPTKALPLYRRALKYGENQPLLNNMAIAHMQMGSYRQAVELLAKAAAYGADPEINMRYAKAAILGGDYETAGAALQSIPEGANAFYLQGLMAYQQEDYTAAINWLEKAKALSDKPEIAHKIADAYVQLGRYDKARASLSPEAPGFHVKMSEIYAASGHAYMPEAIGHLRKALEQKQDSHTNAILWTKLAKYYRTDYDWQRAAEAIANAMPSENNTVLLENARIQKGMGRMREYRAGIGEVIKSLKEQYRAGE